MHREQEQRINVIYGNFKIKKLHAQIAHVSDENVILIFARHKHLQLYY